MNLPQTHIVHCVPYFRVLLPELDIAAIENGLKIEESWKSHLVLKKKQESKQQITVTPL